MLYPYYRAQRGSDKNKQNLTGTHNNLNESHRHNMAQKKPNTEEEYIPNCSIYIKFSHR